MYPAPWRRYNWLPGRDHLFAAFQRDLVNCRYILIGESPYPRRQSANGIAFYDAAVDQLWSDKGLSKAVNRATSLRNIIKTALLAQGLIEPDADGKIEISCSRWYKLFEAVVLNIACNRIFSRLFTVGIF